MPNVKQNLGEIFNKQNSFGEQLYEIKTNSRDLRERLISLENNRDAINPSRTKCLGPRERHLTYDRTPIADRNEKKGTFTLSYIETHGFNQTTNRWWGGRF